MTESQLYRYHFTHWLSKKDEQRPSDVYMNCKAEGLCELLNKISKEFVFQIEDAGSGCHIQGWLKLKRKSLMSPLIREFASHGYAGTHFSAEREDSKLSYVCKEETRVMGPWYSANAARKIKELAAKIIVKPPSPLNPPCEWQRKLIEYLTGPAIPRVIDWLYDPVGNTGKSSLGVHMQLLHDAVYITWADAKHMSCAICEAPTKKIFIFDLTRTKPAGLSMSDLYSMVETVKNGMMRNMMYKSELVCFPTPHVLVLANFIPKQGVLSTDRLNVITLTSSHQAQVQQLVKPTRPRLQL